MSDLGGLNQAQLIAAFSAIPTGVTSLGLGDNDLYHLPAADLARVLAAILMGVTSLGLYENELYRLSAADLARVFPLCAKISKKSRFLFLILKLEKNGSSASYRNRLRMR